MPRLQIFTVDAFSSTPFSGNPAAVVPLDQPLDDEAMQKIAAEMNLSETAYVRPLGKEDAPWTSCRRFSLRWFTPVMEIPLCGHATLASAHVIFQHMGYTGEEVEFETLSGVLKVRRAAAGADRHLTMDFPQCPALPLTPPQHQQLAPLLPLVTGSLLVDQVRLCSSLKYLLICLHSSHSRADLEALTPDYSGMARAHDGSLAMAVLVTVAGDGSPYHACSRFFAPLFGVNEDPVTGSAHTVLGPYWAEQLGKKELKMRQCGGRGGDVEVMVREDGRVDLTGPATTVIQGHISL